jgi:lysozyme family protein
MANFENCVSHVLKVEGGYVNNIDDPGSETNCGITIATARNAGYTGPMTDLTPTIAKQIYKKLYWDIMTLDLVESEDIALELFDSCVNIGPVVGSWLQIILNGLSQKGTLWQILKVDGAVGRGTVGVLNIASKNPKTKILIFNALNSFQVHHYFTIANNDDRFETFMYGWMNNRVSFRN